LNLRQFAAFDRKTRQRLQEQCKSTDAICWPENAPLNFKVAPAFRQAALDSGLKLVELLEVSFESYKNFVKPRNNNLTIKRFR
jgi:hypothetical protein